MILLVLVVCAVLDYFVAPFIERGRLAAIGRGCHSPQCVQWRWWFE